MDRIYQKTKIESKAMQIKNRKYIYNDKKAAACLISAGANTRKKKKNERFNINICIDDIHYKN